MWFSWNTLSLVIQHCSDIFSKADTNATFDRVHTYFLSPESFHVTGALQIRRLWYCDNLRIPCFKSTIQSRPATTWRLLTMVLPDPTLSFTIPSIHDDIPLDCRLYIPHVITNNDVRRAAIIAHPYAPLGGCFDDPIVESVSSEFLKSGWIVGTFNFRYVHLTLHWSILS